MSNLIGEIRELLAKEFGLDDIGDNDPIFSSNTLDSMDVLRLMAALENRYAIKISAFSVAIEMFDTITSIATLVAEKQT